MKIYNTYNKKMFNLFVCLGFTILYFDASAIFFLEFKH